MDRLLIGLVLTPLVVRLIKSRYFFKSSKERESLVDFVFFFKGNGKICTAKIYITFMERQRGAR